MCEDKCRLFCTYCGHGLRDRHGRPTMHLYDVELFAKSKVLKLMPCAQCKAAVADKYVECDGTLLLIDLVLQYKEAYRHVLFNGGYYSLILKMALLAMVCDGYINWTSLPDSGEFFESEFHFYIMCLKALLAVFGLFGIVLVPTATCRKRIATTVWGLLLAYSSRFFRLIALLWSSSPYFNGPVLMFSFNNLLFFISSVRVYQVVQGSSLLESVLLLSLAHAGFTVLLHMDLLLSPMVCVS